MEAASPPEARGAPTVAKSKKPLDECAKLAKQTYKVWPSAYASGYAVQCRNAGGVAKFKSKGKKRG